MTQNMPPHDIEARPYGLTGDCLKLLITAINEQNNDQTTKILGHLKPVEISDVLGIINSDQRHYLIEQLRPNFDAEILVELDSDLKKDVLDTLGTIESAEAITQLQTDDAVDVIENLEESDQQDILEALPDEQRSEVTEGLSYPEDSAGRLLEKNIVSVPEFWNVGQTIDFLRSSKDIPTDFYQIFITDPSLHPVGSLALSRVISADRTIALKELMQPDIKLIDANMDQEDVAMIFRKYGLVSAPVTNDEGRMIGIITVDDIVDVIDEEAEEDILHFGGISESDLHRNASSTIKQRFPWLLINLITAIIASIVIALFEDSIERLAALAVLMPIVASMGGNAGTQTLTVAVRALATKELTGTNALRVVGKEVLVGSLNGIIFAVMAGTLIYLWYGDLSLSIVFAMATVLTLILAGLSGATIPLGLVKLGVDPAIASSVFLTTITDVVAFGAFLGLAAMILL